ncbi:hypothetical protein ACLGL2_00810 [Parvimonas sp. G1641]|uniref:hypothetical protein n=1 Tax=Parvimonas sp. G1641 TaxID=3388846 RepID=UPI0039818F79
MNRQEALNKLKEYYDWNYDVEEYSEEYEKNQKQNLEDIIKYLKQPITLADFLGWEENVEYKVWGDRYKIIDNKLYRKLSKWKTSCYNDNFTDFQQAEKIQPKKYYLKLKDKYCNFYKITKGLDYLNFNEKTDCFFISNFTSFDKYKTQFTLEEIEELKKIEDIPVEHFKPIEVGEDE